MNTFVQQCLSRLAASLGIGCAMLLVGWWCLTIRPVAANGHVVTSSPPAQTDTCANAEVAVYDPTFDTGSRFGRNDDTVNSSAVGDLDLDGDLDLVIGREGDAVIFLNNGEGGFASLPDQKLLDQTPVYMTTYGISPAKPITVAVADMNGNGALDIVLAGDDLNPQVLLNDGTAHFASSVSIDDDRIRTTALAIGDMNGDARFDVVAAYADGPAIVYRNMTPTSESNLPGFGVIRPFGPATATITSLAVGDLSGDSKPEIVAAHTDGRIIVYWNDGQDSFPSTATKTTTLTGRDDSVVSLALVDLDGKDGLDVAAAYPHHPIIRMFLNDGGDSRTFTFESQICLINQDDSVISTTPVGLVAGDVDNDGRPDLVVGLGQLSTKDSATMSKTQYFNRVFLNRTKENKLKFEHRNFGLAGSDDTRAVALADLNDDGALDIITGNQNQQSAVYFNGGEGTLRPIPIPTGKVYIDNIVVGDVDGKNGPDIVAGSIREPNQPEPRLTVYYNDGSGAFATTTVRPSDVASVEVRDVALGDMDRDGDLDIAAAVTLFPTHGAPGLPNYVYVNDGTGSFESHEATSPRVRPFGSQSDNTQSLALGDIDRDGHLDIVAGNRGVQNAVFLNDGSGYFTNTFRFGRSKGDTTSVALGDIDGDGYLDAAVAYQYDPAFIYFNDTTGGFPDNLGKSIGEGINNVSSVALGDINGDGALDIALGSLYGANLVYTNDGKGNFPKAMVQALASGDNNTHDLALGDIDGDGSLDVITTQWYRSTPNQVYLNDGHGRFDTARTRVLEPVAHPKTINPGGNLFTRALGLGDVNQDGTLDIVTGETYPMQSTQHVVVYLNSSRQATGVLGYLPAVVADPPVQKDDGTVPLSYKIVNQDNGPIPHVSVQVVPAGRQPFLSNILTSTVTSEDVSRCLPSGPTPKQPEPTTFAAGFFGFLDDLSVRLLAVPSYCPQRFQVPGPYQWPYGTTTTRPFSVRGSTIKVNANDDVATDQAVVYRKLGDSGRRGLALADAHGEVYRTNFDARLEGLGELHAADQLMALVSAAKPVPYPVSSQYFASSDREPRVLNCSYVMYGLASPPCYPETQELRLAMSDIRRIVTANLTMTLEVHVGISSMKLALEPPMSSEAPASGCSHQVWWLRLEPGTQTYTVPIPPCILYGALDQGNWTLKATLNDIERKAKNSDSSGQADPNQRRLIQGSTYPYVPGVVRALTIKEWGIEATLSPLYYTSAPVVRTTVPSSTRSENVEVLEPDLTLVSDAVPTQTLTIARDNPLLLFDLAVALEWDARNDRQFMEQLSSNLRRVSDLLYDWTNGQAALGHITVYHDARAQTRADGSTPWSDADVRVYATNRLRPNSAQGGIVSQPFAETITSTKIITYVPGSVNIAATWNRYGDTTGNQGEDWPRALAHELGHYLFFLNDNYLGVNDEGLLDQVTGCTGVMADPYRDDDENGYGEFHATDPAWNTDPCTKTLSHKKTGRADWETITTFYPWLKAPDPVRDFNRNKAHTIQRGPDFLPIEVTQVSEIAPVSPSTTRELPVFSLVDTNGGSVQPGTGARAFLFKGKPDATADGDDEPMYDRLVDLGRPRLNQVLARGAQPGDLLCVSDPERGQAGCLEISAAGSDEVGLSVSDRTWQPDIVITPLTTSRSVEVVVTSIPQTTTIMGQLFPLDGPATPPQKFQVMPDQTFVTTFTLADTIPNGHLVLWATDSDRNPLLVTNLTLGGNPAFVVGKVVFSPVLSNDGQVLLYGLKDDQVALLHAVTHLPAPPPWATVIGNAYRLTASPDVDLNGTSLSFSYLGNEVPAGEEGALYVYHWDDNSWKQLETVRNPEQNVASAAIHGTGLYALMSSTEIPLPHAGWNLFGYPVPLPITRPVIDTLGSAGITVTVAFGYDPGNPSDPWQVYVPGVPEVSDLHELTFGHGYFIHTPESGTLRFKGMSPFTEPAAGEAGSAVAAVSDLSLRTPPALVYGPIQASEQVSLTSGMTVTAWVSGTVCGQGRTFDKDNAVWYAVKVSAASKNDAACGQVGHPVTITLDGPEVVELTSTQQITWTNGLPLSITLTPRARSESNLPTLGDCTNPVQLVKNGNFETRTGWTMVHTSNPARYTTDTFHDGMASMKLGLTATDPPGARPAFSSGYQFVRIPSNALTTTLSFWYRTDMPPQGGDYRRVLLLDSTLKLLQELTRLPDADNTWRQARFDVRRFKGRNIGLYFETYNDNAASTPRTWMAIDDVSLTVCR